MEGGWREGGSKRGAGREGERERERKETRGMGKRWRLTDDSGAEIVEEEEQEVNQSHEPHGLEQAQRRHHRERAPAVHGMSLGA
eukprot:116816-Rhodomonas_salina.1